MKEAERRVPFESRMSLKQKFTVCAAIKLRRDAESLLFDEGKLSHKSIAISCGLTTPMARKVMFDIDRYRSRPYYKKIKPFYDWRATVRTNLDRLGFKIIEFELDIGRESAHRLAAKYMDEYKNLAQHKQKGFELEIKEMFNLGSEA